MNCYIDLDELCRYSAADELRIFCAFWRATFYAFALFKPRIIRLVSVSGNITQMT